MMDSVKKARMSRNSDSKNILPLATILSGLIAVAIVAGGCAHRGAARSGGGAVGAVIRNSDTDSALSTSSSYDPSASVTPGDGELEVRGQRLKNSSFDYPVVVNPKVEQWIGYFTGKGRRWFDKYLERGRYFIPEIAKTLKDHKMPQDLVYLAMIESGFNNVAKSHAKAVGPWQFMKFTGKRYGLAVDYWMDERRDTHKATLAAIKYLSELYQEFGSWELASAGYNAGEGKVRRAIKRYKSKNFWELSKHKFFRPETRDYVPKIIAAAIITKNPEQFGFADPFGKNSLGKVVRNPTLFDDGEEAEGELTPKELGEPTVTQSDISEDAEAIGEKQEVLAQDIEADDDAGDYDESDDAHAMLSNDPTAMMTPSVYLVTNPNEKIIEFELKGPADLFAVSKASGLPFSTVKLLNPELLRWCTPPTMKTYRLKLPQSVKNRFLATYNDPSFDRKVVFYPYKIRRGDSIKGIAKRFKIYESDAIREVNTDRLRLVNTMKAGGEILLPVPTGYKRVIASMYDEKPSPSRRKRVKRKYRARRSSLENSREAQNIRRSHLRLRPKLVDGA